MTHKTKKNKKISVIGAGMWGASLADLLARQGCRVLAWEYNKATARSLNKHRKHPAMPDFVLHEGVEVRAELDRVVLRPDLLLIAVDSSHVRGIARTLNTLLAGRPLPPIIAVSKGIEAGTLKTVCEVLESEIPRARGRTMIMTGPSFAVEVAAGAPTKVVLAGRDAAGLKRAAALMEGGPLKLELSDDRLGAELGGSLKNVYAIGSGIIDGLSKAAKNSEAAFLIESASELRRIITALGGRSRTAWGLSGMGDLLLTATSAKSRNFRFGREIGHGHTTAEAQKRIKTVVEGFEALKNARALCAKHGLKSPVIECIWKIIYQGHAPASILEAAGFRKRT
ncbi:MAG TPA: NAD(P)H-dependent glycerol-3-phosphate dehydrogenase [Elusimicrobiales bacterium]|nr:NAD(P)H-dependent glycerol-3-phosphate dehydrogenase [Elusimicrobiales bacterium]